MTERWTLDLDAWPGQAAIKTADGTPVCYVILSDEVGQDHPEGRLFRRVTRPQAVQRAKLISKAPEMQELLQKFVDDNKGSYLLLTQASKLLGGL